MQLRFLLLVCATWVAVSCKSTGEIPTPNQPITANSTVTPLPSDGDIEAMREAFFSRAAEEEEVYRVFVTSDGYTRKQIAAADSLALKDDKTGDQTIANEFHKFDMVNSLQEGQIRVELYPTTGKFYRVRQAKPSIMKETDRIMSDDITRWQFQFPKGQIVPRDFRVSYQILLRKKVTRDHALKILSDQNSKKK